jgi:hypothetical protein
MYRIFTTFVHPSKLSRDASWSRGGVALTLLARFEHQVVSVSCLWPVVSVSGSNSYGKERLENENDDDEDDCSKAQSDAQGGRERLCPNRGLPATSGRRVNPNKRTAARCSAQRILAGAPSPNTEPSMNRSFRSSVHHSGSSVWVHAFSRVGREAPVRTEPRPTALSVALRLEQSFSSSSPFSREG